MRLALGAIFLVIFAIVLVAVSFGLRFLERQRRKQVEEVLTAVAGDQGAPLETTILRPSDEDEDAGASLLRKAGLASSLTDTIQQAGVNWTPSSLLMAMLVAAVLGALLAAVFLPAQALWVEVPVFAGALASIPLIYLRIKRAQRIREFEEMLPEALDFLARSMRAGHAFTISLGMVGEEFTGVLGQEFRTMFNELNFGAPMEVAMENFARRVPLLDVRLMASSVLLQRQTGGNLSEVLNRLAFIIRERFRLRGQIRAASAHGRITALSLTLMPLVMFLLLPIFAPGYLQGMIADPDGLWLLLGAGVAQVLGYLIMRKITDIKA